MYTSRKFQTKYMLFTPSVDEFTKIHDHEHDARCLPRGCNSPLKSAPDRIRKPPFDQFLITHTTTMVHEVHGWGSDSDYVDDDEHDELDQDPLMHIQDRVKPAELREMSVATVCRTSPCSNLPSPLWGKYLTPDRTHMRRPNRFEPGIPER
jgi:hypothetical protein